MSNLGDMEAQSRKFSTASDVNQTLNQTFLFCETGMSEALEISDGISDDNTTDAKGLFCERDINCLPLLDEDKFEVTGTDLAVVHNAEDSIGVVDIEMISQVTGNSKSDEDSKPFYHSESFEPAAGEDSFEISKPNSTVTSPSLTEPPGDTKLLDGSKGKYDDEVDEYESVPEPKVAPVTLKNDFKPETSISHQTIVILISLGFLVSLFVAVISPITTAGFYADPPST